MATAAFIMSRDEVVENDAFRRVLYTGEHQQYVAVALRPGESVGAKRHSSSQTAIFYDGKGLAYVAEEEPEPVAQGKAILIEPGTQHDFEAAPKSWLRYLCIYSPPLFTVGLVQQRKPAAEDEGYAAEEGEERNVSELGEAGEAEEPYPPELDEEEGGEGEEEEPYPPELDREDSSEDSEGAPALPAGADDDATSSSSSSSSSDEDEPAPPQAGEGGESAPAGQYADDDDDEEAP